MEMGSAGACALPAQLLGSPLPPSLGPDEFSTHLSRNFYDCATNERRVAQPPWPSSSSRTILEAGVATPWQPTDPFALPQSVPPADWAVDVGQTARSYSQASQSGDLPEPVGGHSGGGLGLGQPFGGDLSQSLGRNQRLSNFLSMLQELRQKPTGNIPATYWREALLLLLTLLKQKSQRVGTEAALSDNTMSTILKILPKAAPESSQVLAMITPQVLSAMLQQKSLRPSMEEHVFAVLPADGLESTDSRECSEVIRYLSMLLLQSALAATVSCQQQPEEVPEAELGRSYGSHYRPPTVREQQPQMRRAGAEDCYDFAGSMSSGSTHAPMHAETWMRQALGEERMEAYFLQQQQQPWGHGHGRAEGAMPPGLVLPGATSLAQDRCL